MKYFEIEGRTAEEAINGFLAEKNIPKDYIETEVIESGSKGFLGFGSKSAKVKIVFNDVEYFKRKAKLMLSEMLDKAGFQDHNIEVSFESPNIILNIMSPDSSILIGKNAQTLDSFQFLVDKMIFHEDMGGLGVMVDVEGYRKRTVKNLTEKAIKLARNVKKNGKPAKMGPMVTMIRKEIHIALKSVGGISTISKGQGNVKDLLIVPERRNRRPRQDSGKRRQESDS